MLPDLRSFAEFSKGPFPFPGQPISIPSNTKSKWTLLSGQKCNKNWLDSKFKCRLFSLILYSSLRTLSLTQFILTKIWDMLNPVQLLASLSFIILEGDWVFSVLLSNRLLRKHYANLVQDVLYSEFVWCKKICNMMLKCKNKSYFMW